VTQTLQYAGGELELFREARNWKRYLRQQLSPHIRGDVLEVGAGIGGTTAILHGSACTSWTCLEPDAVLLTQLTSAVASLGDSAGRPPRAIAGTLGSLEAESRYDCILYVDVLEHIEHDRQELATAFAKLRAGGVLVVLSPAHQWLYTPFDAAIGHFRRYDRQSLCAVAPPGELVCLRYLDTVGIAASLGNRLLMRKSMPTAGQIRTWDQLMVPVSRVLDPLLAYRLGKSIVAVWRRPA
jgi:SAM-dependent methyltransferase